MEGTTRILCSQYNVAETIQKDFMFEVDFSIVGEAREVQRQQSNELCLLLKTFN